MARRKPQSKNPDAAEPAHRPASAAPEAPARVADFEAALAELETLVEQMEQGEMTLEESLSAFEHGVRLTRTCQQALAAAEQRVEILRAGEETPQPFEPDAAADDDAS